MKRYYLTVLGHKEYTIECDGVRFSHSGVYEFWKYKEENDNGELIKRVIDIAYYPINRTIINKIEEVKLGMSDYMKMGGVTLL